MKVSELTIPQLNEWVAKALGWQIRLWGAIPVWFDPNKENRFRSKVSDWNPSENWLQGGAIIERKKIGQFWDKDNGCWNAHVRVTRTKFYCHRTGGTALIAAMRAFVASKFGEEVPDE